MRTCAACGFSVDQPDAGLVAVEDVLMEQVNPGPPEADWCVRYWLCRTQECADVFCDRWFRRGGESWREFCASDIPERVLT